MMSCYTLTLFNGSRTRSVVVDSICFNISATVDCLVAANNYIAYGSGSW